MLINNNDVVKHVKFISYTGKYPNLCRGILTLEINGEVVKFGDNFNSFWHSGGSCGLYSGEEYIDTDAWVIDVSKIPESYRQYASEIDIVFNANVPQGCCGGCL
jgi:hypothetical protein